MIGEEVINTLEISTIELAHVIIDDTSGTGIMGPNAKSAPRTAPAFSKASNGCPCVFAIEDVDGITKDVGESQVQPRCTQRFGAWHSRGKNKRWRRVSASAFSNHMIGGTKNISYVSLYPFMRDERCISHGFHE